jgi:hypothetical protein
MSAPDRRPIRIPITHPNVRNAESFLNSWAEPFIPEKSEGNHFSFRTESSGIRVTVFFFDGYDEAVAYEQEHANRDSASESWTQNGTALYAISGKDANLVRSLAGHFAGLE